MKRSVSTQDCIIMDACCVISLYATGRMGEILCTISETVSVANYVKEKESLTVYDGPPGDERSNKKAINLDPLIAESLLTEIHPSGDELKTFVRLASEVDDGEAYTGAIAIHRNWALATDDIKSIRVLSSDPSKVTILSTLDLVKHWVDVTNPPAKVVHETLMNIRVRASYEPHKSHPLYDWWEAHISPKPTP